MQSTRVLEPATPVRTIRRGTITSTPRGAWSDPFFTVDEDLFLVRQRCFAPPRFGSDAEFRHAFCTHFQTERSTAQLAKRFAQLAASSPHHGILRMYVSTLLATGDGDVLTREMVKPDFVEFVDMAGQLKEILDAQQRGDEVDMPATEMDSIHLEVVSKRFSPYELDVSKHELRKCSNVVDRFLQHAADAANRFYSNGTLTYHPAAGASRERLILTDDVAAYDKVNCYKHLSQPIVQRLVLFAKDDHTVERRLVLADEYERVEKTNRLCSDEINGLYASEIERYVGALDDAKQREVEKTTAFLDQALADDMQALQAMHVATVENERARIHAKYADRRETLVRRIEAERTKAMEMYRDSMEITLLQIEHAMAVNAQQVDAVFGTSECLLQLLILAEDLDCKKLRKSCVNYLTEPGRFLQFALRRELTCPLMAENTILALLQHLSDEDAKALRDCCGFAFHDLLLREVHTRLIALTKELEALPNAALRDVMRLATDKATPAVDRTRDTTKLGLASRAYPQVLTKELQRRREFSRVKLNASLLSNHVSITDDDLVLELESTHRYCTAVATKQRSAGELGRWMFEARVEELDPVGGSVAIGWEVPRSALQWGPSDVNPAANVASPVSPRGLMARFGERKGYGMVLPGLTPSDDGKNFGILWQSDASLSTDAGMGILYINGKQHSGVPCFHRGDVVGCAIDQDATEPFVEFYLNGQLVLPVEVPEPGAAELKHAALLGRQDHHHQVAVIHRKLLLESANYALVPAVTLFSSHEPNARVRFNFRGNFEFPIRGYDPYGAELLDLLELANEGGISDPIVALPLCRTSLSAEDLAAQLAARTSARRASNSPERAVLKRRQSTTRIIQLSEMNE
ncbi:Aste57867_15447 [Aphanomyces stellatus]|uniref:Aste57867_15447 protein n=1 Tax=Aphanomyces stellatus TaxID=120398 RepID=A0A485L357_9STRA|nr:hypothetical protein As57867_015391 [Aphanomyces stellatus]VFT92249.1 Aste57867_15447 [Aphanomyces stellatus]